MIDMNQNLGDLMKEAQKMQSRMQEAQEELTQLNVTGVAGPVSNPMLSVTINGRYNAISAYVNPALREDLDMLPDLITAAINDAVRKVEKESKKKISELTASLNIPTGFLKEEDKIYTIPFMPLAKMGVVLFNKNNIVCVSTVDDEIQNEYVEVVKSLKLQKYVFKKTDDEKIKKITEKKILH